MTDVVTTAIGSGYNATKINDNIDRLGEAINRETLHRRGGNNTMEQNLDMNGYPIYNIGTDTSNPSSAVTQAQFDDLVAELEAEIRDRVAFLIDGDVVIGEGVNLGTAAFEDIQTGYYQPGEFDTAGEKKVLINGAFGLGSELAAVGSYTGNLDSIDPVTGLSTTQFRHVEGSATNLPRDGEPGYLIHMQKDSDKSSQLFISEEGTGENDLAWDTTAIAETGSITTFTTGTYAEAMLWHPEGTHFYACAANGAVISMWQLTTPYDLSTRVFVGLTDYSTEMGGIAVDNLTCMGWGLDGNSIIIAGPQQALDNKIVEVQLSTPYDTTTKTTYVEYTHPNAIEKKSMWVSQDVRYIAFIRGDGSSSGWGLHELSVPGDLSTIGPIVGGTITAWPGADGIVLSEDGTKMLAIRPVSGVVGEIREYTMSTPFLPTTAILTNTAAIATSSTLVSFTVDNTGTYVVVSQFTGGDCKLFTLGAVADLGPGVFYRTKIGNNWEDWKRFITDADPANLAGTFTVGGEIDIPIVAGIATLDCSLGNSFNLEVTEDVLLTFDNAPEVGDDYTCKVKVTNGGNFVFTLDSNIKVAGGVLPPLTVNGVDIAVLTFNGPDIYGLISIPDAR